MTTPGVPDLYQGTEWWDFSLVDPDNRQPVDFPARAAALADADAADALLHRWRDGRLKQQLIARTLRLRQRLPALFARGRYEPVAFEGAQAERAIGFVRADRQSMLLVVVPRCCASLVDADVPRVLPERWQDTRVRLPAAMTRSRWADALQKRSLQGDALRLSGLLDAWPVALLAADTQA
jgi:(1->4)-alpha-D-glucan 1-alpha-D-glucosylmutase